jgi:hypothetical protein
MAASTDAGDGERLCLLERFALKIKYEDGPQIEARILTLSGDTMRVALRDSDDAMELRLIAGTWFSEGLQPVSFEFPLATDLSMSLQESATDPQKAAAEPACGHLSSITRVR